MLMRGVLLRGLVAARVNQTVAFSSRFQGSLLSSCPPSSLLKNQPHRQVVESQWRWYTTIPRVVPEEAKPKGIRVDTDRVRIFTREEVAKHNTRDDCWIVLHGKVLNVSQWIWNHPGGAEAIVKYAGKDATDAFELQQHQNYVYDMLSQFQIGKIETKARYEGFGDLDSTLR
eukprot:CAMPEP_0201507274 /NCGR_PEP_ID=MMETSP0161_2-20130828/986_1 /ASSEMBLY_ACC=CAM_ASM_000251 /TAXON_ID=180227 /ORGANISM="Neoparamoeba aestuarina, Strain SoJaBio B1-5/56/2" /LENGTH=171 /DNA_ID=CAMNT_0047901591 /DNA_START=44 /DNA_END=559 /DNA_ORIENTATION=+